MMIFACSPGVLIVVVVVCVRTMQELQRLQTEVVAQREGCQQAVAMRTAAQAEAAHLRTELQQLRTELEQGSWRKARGSPAQLVVA